MTSPVRVLVTGAAGNIGYSIIPLICNGSFLGPDQPIILHILDIPPCLEKLQGVKMEVEDCAFPLLKGIVATVDVQEAFTDLDYAFLIGAFPRREGMERKELLAKNAAIFEVQGKALSDYSKKTVKVLVVGNPANTNALIAQRCAPNIPKENFSAMTRLDHNRAISMAASKAGVAPNEVSNVIIWGNHSSTQYPDLSHAKIAGAKATEKISDKSWIESEFITSVQKRGAAIIKARGLSSAASAAIAAVDHMRDWALGTPKGTHVSMAVVSDGSYGIEAGLVYSYPVTISNGAWSIVQGLEISEFSKGLMKATEKELTEERADAFAHLGL